MSYLYTLNVCNATVNVVALPGKSGLLVDIPSSALITAEWALSTDSTWFVLTVITPESYHPSMPGSLIFGSNRVGDNRRETKLLRGVSSKTNVTHYLTKTFSSIFFPSYHVFTYIQPIVIYLCRFIRANFLTIPRRVKKKRVPLCPSWRDENKFRNDFVIRNDFKEKMKIEKKRCMDVSGICCGFKAHHVIELRMEKH